MDIRIYKYVRERKVIIKHENPRHDIVYYSPKTTAGTRHGETDPMMRITWVKKMTFMT